MLLLPISGISNPKGELKQPLSEYAIDTLLMLTRHPVCQTRRGRTLVIRIYYRHMLDASSTSSRLHHKNFVRASMIDVWQFIFVRGSVHPQPMARSQTREMFNRFSVDVRWVFGGFAVDFQWISIDFRLIFSGWARLAGTLENGG